MQQFEKAVLGRSSRSRSQTTPKVGVVEDDSEEDKGTGSEDEDGDRAPKRRPVSPRSSFVVSRPLRFTKHVQTTARKSIMAFLQDQSDEE